MTADRRRRLVTTGRWRLQAGFLGMVAVALVAAVALAACTSTTTTTTTTTSTSTTTTTLPPVNVSKTEIETAYMTLFDLSNPAVAPKLLVVQDGSALKAAFTAALRSTLAKEATGAEVLSIKIEQGGACTKEFLPSPCAAVVYNILGPKGTGPVLKDLSGGAVYLSSKWLVAKATICALLTLENSGVTPAGC
ncbi:MAG TPA: hypothetical protein VEH29_03340 [Acidimicrobiales bacterium]|nr:hypothetical protein [Acidimicrobiales bacterium]